jgi:hippurate hydrolase
VVTIGIVNAGTASNVIPERAELRGTLRATDHETRALLRAEVRDISTHIAAAHRVEAKVSFSAGVPPVINDARAAQWAADAATALFGAEAVVPLGITNMAGEDFAWYQHRIPGCFLRVGAREQGEAVIPAHSPQFDVSEEAIFVGAAVLAECARRASADLAAERS